MEQIKHYKNADSIAEQIEYYKSLAESNMNHPHFHPPHPTSTQMTHSFSESGKPEDLYVSVIYRKENDKWVFKRVELYPANSRAEF